MLTKLMRYTAYGLNFESELHFPEFLPGTNGRVDVSIRYGKVPRSLANPKGRGGAYQAEPGRFLLKLKGVGRYLVLNGREVWINRTWYGSDEDLRRYFLSSALAALLLQRNVLTLHASAIRAKGGAVLFLGGCGTGKSSLLGAMLKRGYAMLADDVTGVVFNASGRPLALPGYPIVQLTATSAAQLQQPVDGLQRVSPDLKRFFLPVTRFCSEPVPINAIYELKVHGQSEIGLERVGSEDKARVVTPHIYGMPYLDGLGLRQAHFKSVAAAAKGIRVVRATRPSHPFLLDELASRVEADIF